ncbi:MAG: dTMP kinase [Mycoplasma sp.]|nr:dTMP kinase [Mycoplasma sp.]
MFITFEGIDGSGKSTCIKKLKEFIEKNCNKDNFVFTREPGGYNLKECEQIREILLNKENKLDNMSEMLLYLASRKIHVDRLIKPRLDEGRVVLSDRFFDSSFAYQGGGRKLGINFVEELNLKVLNNFMPNFTFYFKVDFNTAMNRMKLNNKNLDRLEIESKEFFEETIKAYDLLSKKYPNRYIIIDASKSEDDVFDLVLNKFKKIINFSC